MKSLVLLISIGTIGVYAKVTDQVFATPGGAKLMQQKKDRNQRKRMKMVE